MLNTGTDIWLRRIEEKDLKKVFDLRNNSKVYKWCRQNAPLHIANHKKWYEWQASDPSVDMFYAYMTNSDHEYFVGVCGLTSIDMVNRRAEFSCYIDPEYQNRGYGKRTLITLFKYGFDSLGLNRIWGETFDGNPALGLFEKIGMEREGIRRDFYYRNGRFIDAHLVSIDRNSFIARNYANYPEVNYPTSCHDDDHGG